MKKVITALLFLQFLSCISLSNKDFTSHAVWNNNKQIFERDLVQLGYMTPYFNVYHREKMNDSVYIKARTNFDFKFISDNKKFLIECNKEGQVMDTVVTLKNETEIFLYIS